MENKPSVMYMIMGVYMEVFFVNVQVMHYAKKQKL